MSIEIEVSTVAPIETTETDIRYRVLKHVSNAPGDIGSPQPDDDDDDIKHSFFAKGRDLESAYVNHKYTEKEQEILQKYESLDYLPPHNKVYKDWIRGQPARLDWDRWVMMGLIGFLVGVVGFLLHQFIDILAELKWEKAREFIEEEEYFFASLWVIGISVLLVFVSSSTVVLLRPCAGGSGLPEVIAYLNGTLVHHIFNVKTLCIKFLSCVCAVASGLPVGPEGPMVHLGALVGAGCSQLKSSTLGFRLPFFKRFRNSEDRRNFISAGAAAGVASAFGAPVGGLLFSMEEVSSFWNMKLSWQTFFCCMVATFTTDLFNSAFTAFQYEGNFGLFKTEKYILFQVNTAIVLNIIALVPVVIVGAVGGLMGAAFTFINLKICRARRKVLSSIKSVNKQKLTQICEPIIIMIIMGTVSVFLPSLFTCTSFNCSWKGSEQPHCNLQVPVHVEDTVENYRCPKGVTTTVGDVKYTNGSFSEVATLLFLTGERAIRHLFSRETHIEFNFVPLFVVLPIYFLLACWVAGTSIASGVVVPKMFIGGLMGRIMGRTLVEAFGVHTDQYWAWMDPGAFALLGAAAFFGGVSRLTMSLTVIMVELTNDVQFLLLIMVAIMVSKWVGDYATHPFYHSLLELKCIPFLDSEPVVLYDGNKNLNLELFECSSVMSHPVTTLRTRVPIVDLAKLMLESKHGGFPIVKSVSGANSTFFGLITRTELNVLMCHEEIFEDVNSSNEELPEVLSVDYSEFCDDNIEKLGHSSSFKELLHKLSSDHYKNLCLNVAPYANRSAVCVRQDFSLHRTYIIFRSLGLRHLTVVDECNQVKGIITRKDLMGYNIELKLSVILTERLQKDSLCQEMNCFAAPPLS